MNPMAILQLKSAFDGFKARHPKVIGFAQTISRTGINEGSVLEITVKTPEGESYTANMKVTREDLELLAKLKELQ